MELIYKFISHSPFHRNHLIGFRKARRGGKGSFVSQRNRGTRTREEEEEEGETWRPLDRPSKPFPFASRGEIRNNNGRGCFL